MSSFQSKLPVLLSVSFVLAIVAIVARRFGEWHGETRIAVVLMVGAYLAWLAIESRVAVGEVGKGSTSLDRGTLELYAFGRAATMLTAVAFGQPKPVLAELGFVLFVAAVAFRLVAIRTLGAFYSHRVRVVGGHAIVSSGPYRVLRHPAYTGMLLAHAGIALFFYTPIALTVLALVLLPAIVLRIRVEERVLMQIDGYREYSEARARLVPRVW
jgi:protein-S-isoprenylcysteine O-methyltransferase Ste14